jgi:hypothetical protein
MKEWEDTSWIEDYPDLFGAKEDKELRHVLMSAGGTNETEIATWGKAFERAAVRPPNPNPLLGKAWRGGWYERLRRLYW